MLAFSTAAEGAVTEYPQDLAGFTVAAGYPSVAIDFDAILPASDITNQTLGGVMFQGPGAALIVVLGTDTFTPGGSADHRLFPTSGENALSPGGNELECGNPSLENDDLVLVFDPSVAAFGLDVLEQSINGGEFIHVRVYDADDNELLSSTIPTPPGNNAPGGAHFYGVVSDERNIARIEFDETDGDCTNPDGNIGYDSLRFIVQDCNTNGVEDEHDIASGTSLDCDSNGVPDECDPDCDSDGTPDVCEIASPELAWRRATEQAAWPARAGHAAVAFGGRMWLYGGGAGTSRFNDVWWSNDGADWTEATADADWPARSQLGGEVHDGKMWVVGGSGSGGGLLNDVWYSTNGVSWTEAPASPWSPRQPAVVGHADSLWLMGGWAGENRRDVWRSPDGINWEPKPDAPWAARQAFGAMVFQDEIWIMGGTTGGTGCPYFYDVWHTSDGLNWTAAPAAPWPNAVGAAALSFHERMWVLGGATCSGLSNQVWSSADGTSWAQDMGAPVWAPRYLHAAVVFKNRIWVLGGDSPNAGAAVNDVWYATLTTDCNDNGTPDECELLGNDCNSNGMIDECDLDFDGDSLIDDCDDDIDNDGVENGLAACDFTPPGAPIIGDPASCLFGTLREDLDGDCDVDLADYAIFAGKLTGPRT